mgnify:CR=1 FL=1
MAITAFVHAGQAAAGQGQRSDAESYTHSAVLWPSLPLCTQGKLLLAKGSAVTLTGEELQGLRQEMAQQEMLIQGFQQENEVATQKIKVR